MKPSYLLCVSCCVAVPTFFIANSSPPAKLQDKAAPAQLQDDEQSELPQFMRQKLKASNQILEGLVVNDLAKVNLGADKLLKMSDTERWRATKDVVYSNHSREFQRSVQAMRSKAKKKSIDGAALAWIDVTMSCIHCHEWVRDTMIASGVPPAKDGVLVVGSELSGTIKLDD